MRYLRLGRNMLTGSIPPELGNLGSLGTRLFSNQLTGSIPGTLGELSRIWICCFMKTS